MYAVAPAASDAWTRLFAHVSALSGIRLEVIEHGYPAPLAELWNREDLGCAFMCGWPLAREMRAMARPRPILAAPVPAASWSAQGAIYRSDFVVAADAGCRVLEDMFGARFAFNAAGSHSGFNMPRAHLARFADRTPLFADLVGPLVTPRRCIEAVAEGRAEITAVDSYALDLLRRHDPALAARVRVLDSTQANPIPPLVGAATLPDEAQNRLHAALVTLHLAQSGRALLEDVCLLRFAPARAQDYTATLRAEPVAAQAGYSVLA